MLDAGGLAAEHGAMESSQPLDPSTSPASGAAAHRAWRALALALAALLAALVFAAYTQPELLLNYSGLRYCG